MMHTKKANVDEVFVDLCRQMLRRDDSHDESRDDLQKPEDASTSRKKRNRRKRKDRDHRCMIL